MPKLFAEHVFRRVSRPTTILKHTQVYDVTLFRYLQHGGSNLCCRLNDAPRSPHVYRVVQKWNTFLYALTSLNIDRFPQLFHCQNQENICTSTTTKDPITPQVCRYTTL